MQVTYTAQYTAITQGYMGSCQSGLRLLLKAKRLPTVATAFEMFCSR